MKSVQIVIILICSVSCIPFGTFLDDLSFSLEERAANTLCGKQNGGALCPSSVGKCCSQYGYCGNTTDYCGIGCQSGSCIYTRDGTCGSQNGATLCTTSFGTCCSQYGYCGNTTAYCGLGCQSGSCLYSKNDTCGSQNGGLLCSGNFGNCCSQYGYCGNTTAYCGLGCQSGSCLYSKNDTCGSQNGGLLCSSNFGDCCSQYGYCGNTTAYCGQGCQSGLCNKGAVSYGGINIAGCDFGMDTNGNAGTSNCPSSVGPTQMQHFTTKDKFNIFRLPVGWQYLVNSKLGGVLDSTFFPVYDALVQSCLSTGAYCIIDIHNYARWNGGIIGQGGPTNAQFTSLWSQLASHYASTSRIILGVMNEPHDLDIKTWAVTVQATVNAIRAAGATNQMILIPGMDWSGASSFVQDSASAMSSVVDYDGSTSKLIYDIHQYYDIDSSGTHSTCVTDHVSGGFTPLAAYLRSNGRQALMTETGGGSTTSCLQYVCSALTYLNANADVYLGWVGWAAGSFTSSYALSETPQGSVDTTLVTQCLAGLF